MSRSAVNAKPYPPVATYSNRVSGHRDIDSSVSVKSRLRSNRHSQDIALTAAETQQANKDSHRQNSPADVSQTVEETPTHRVRQDTAVHTHDLSDGPAFSHRHSESPPLSALVEPVSQICLCQPEPKIPRPRNAFILYRQHHQQNITTQHTGLSNPEISKVAGELWRAESEEIKNEWKLLAEEEKARHAQQYPDYRFQPRHKNKTYPHSTPGQRSKCDKCGGLSIAGNTSPFPTPAPTRGAKHLNAGFPESAPSTPVLQNKDGDISPTRRMMLDQNSQQFYQDKRYVSTSSPMTRKFPDGAVELSDTKRRCYDSFNGGGPTTRAEYGRTPISSRHAFQHGYPSPCGNTRRGSLPPPPESTHYPRGALGHATASPGQVSPHVTAMGPPPIRVASIGGRQALHSYLETPTSALHHGLPQTPAGLRNNSESLRLAPLLSPGARNHSQSVEAMIMGIPALGKIKQLRRISPPLKEAAPGAPPYGVRGTIIAIEGDDKVATDDMLRQLETSLRREDDFDVRVLLGPQDPSPNPELKGALEAVAKCHDQTKAIIDFITGVEYQRAEEQPSVQAQAQRKQYIASSGTNVCYAIETDAEEGEEGEEGEVANGTRKDEQDARRQTRGSELDKKRADMTASIERESRRQSVAQVNASRVPLVLISNHVLHGSNAWASALPIEDLYSPADHWTWTATLFRGIVGADLTVYVKNVDKDKEEPISAGAHSGQMEKTVEMKDEIGAIVVKRDGGKLDHGSVRRVAFEIGECVRIRAGKQT